eukprot:CAMPEP_0173385738 /NCGR_PEP_ID=MMETSP1356-20130122/8342_1 /TAXON_ID=77927 ORGANISM="Hemiselmis virescens, Strain PCC157" /NCGR_SAMPLE_ID=MMETSP1356 /ASSEMBLY_ACC=CAM_ASM_000847 /LENGTH=54 /DNA_ID=CAMNT_0014341667 /DNA_START=242 /DNA_END=406 /DNA_ORIENTATION=+
MRQGLALQAQEEEDRRLAQVEAAAKLAEPPAQDSLPQLRLKIRSFKSGLRRQTE